MRERSPSRPKEDGVELAVIPKKHPQAFWDGKDGVAMRDILNNDAVYVLGKLHRSLRPARGAYPSAFAGERDKKRVLASITIHPSGTVSEYTAD